MPNMPGYGKVSTQDDEFGADNDGSENFKGKKNRDSVAVDVDVDVGRDDNDDGGDEDDEDSSEPKSNPCAALYARCCYFVPLACMLVTTACCFALCVSHRPLALAVLTVYMVHHAYCYLFHVTFFSLVGQVRIQRAELVNYREQYDERAAQREAEGTRPGPEELMWEDVSHFVVLPNYKEDIDILREAIDTLAISTVARTQMGVVLAMEAREAGVQAKAEELLEEYRLKFKYVMATYHPPGLPNEMPGKASNTRWAAQRLWAFLDAEGVDQDRVIVTVADADSDFHPVYFEALTYNVCCTASLAARENSIWQAPIMHYKNFHSQPVVVKLASLFVSQHELANLADDTATPLPYSTYSITSNLAKKVGGWDPDWISEDWHMFLKCFLHTKGAVSVVPVMLPIINYTPEADTWWGTVWARWTQAKRHALGVAEMVYFLSNLPAAYAKTDGLGGAWFLFYRGLPIIYKMFAIHIVMSTYWLFSSANGPLLWWVWHHPEEDELGSWREFWIWLNVLNGVLCVVLFLGLNVLSVTLYNGIKDRIVPVPDGAFPPQWFYNNLVTHYLYMLVGCTLMAPVMNTAGGVAEWLAAFKTAKSHKFEYEVALKPKAAKNIGT